MAAVRAIDELDRREVRRRFDRRFSATAMARGYLDVYADRLAAPAVRRQSWTLPSAERRRRRPIARIDVARRRSPRSRAHGRRRRATRASADEATVASGVELVSLKDGRRFLVADHNGDVIGGADGLFDRDTRVLSRFVFLVGDAPSDPALVHALARQRGLHLPRRQPRAAAGERPRHAARRDPHRAAPGAVRASGSTSGSAAPTSASTR